jgi:predicted XRE-type DNA-binding protein
MEIKKLKKSGRNQPQIAKAFQVQQSTISRILNGKRRVHG